MEEDSLDDLKGVTIQDLLNDINPSFYKILKKAVNLNRIRAIELCTYLLNFQIQLNYFHSFKTLMREVPDLNPDLKKPFLFDEYLIGSERIYGIILLLSLTYRSQDPLSSEETDQHIDDLTSYGPLVNKFFVFNTINSENYSIELVTLLNKVKPYRRIDALIPDLRFDPEYASVLNCEAIKQLYDTSFIKDFLNSKPPKPYKFPLNKTWVDKYVKTSRSKKLFEVNYNLKIGKFMQEYCNYMGVQFFSLIPQIISIIEAFKSYYIKRIPSEKKQIKANFTGFSELLKITEGRLFIKLKSGNLVKKLRKKMSEYEINWFFKRFCFSIQNEDSSNFLMNLDARTFLSEYNKFLSYCMYNVSGIGYTGVMLIWRAFIKYLERIQQQDEFQKFKGIYLENACYYKALEYGFQSQKIIFRNPKLPPSEKYNLMKKQIIDFEGPILELNATFPEKSMSSFEEIDLAFRIDEFLFLFECKATGTYRGEQDTFLYWINKFNKNIRSLKWKGRLVLNNSKNQIFKDPFLKEIKYFISYQIQTEGLFSDYTVLSLGDYQNLLSDTRKLIDSKEFKNYMKSRSSYWRSAIID